MRGARPVVLLAAGLLVFAPVPERAGASCAPPQLKVRGVGTGDRGATGDRGGAVRAGERVTVDGRGFLPCSDAGGCTETLGCTRCEEPSRSSYGELELRLVQGDRSWPVATATPTGRDDRAEPGRIRWRFTVPEGVAPGPATLESRASLPERVRVLAAKPGRGNA